MKHTGLSAPRWALLAPAAAPPVLTFDEPSLELLSRTGSHNSSDAPPPEPHGEPHSISQPLQPAGGICSPEGQWNCMTNSWQRCASGTWSAVVPCAPRTICQPFGLTDFITIEHDPIFDDGHGDNGHASDGRADDGHEKGGKKSLGLRNSPSLVMLVGALLTGVSWRLMG